jgi:SAM-dependent methyltransferase
LPLLASDTRQCPLCSSDHTSLFVEKKGYSFLRCANCELVFVHPELAQQSLLTIYADQGAPAAGDRYPFDKAGRRRQMSAARMKPLKGMIAGKAAIDVGCGGGFIVDAMKRLGAAKAVGIDLDPQAISFASKTHAAGCEFFCETIDTFLKRGQTFDFGHSAQVIEHVGAFNAFVEGWAQLIKPGGTFFLKTPDRRHWWAGRDPMTWPNPPNYTQYFSRKSISLLLRKHGFEVLWMKTSFKPTIETLARREVTLATKFPIQDAAAS